MGCCRYRRIGVRVKLKVRKARTGQWWVLSPEEGRGYPFNDWETAIIGSKWVNHPKVGRAFVPIPIEGFEPWVEPISWAEWERRHRWVTTPGTLVYLQGRKFVTGESEVTGPNTASVRLIPVDKPDDPWFPG